MAHQWFKLHAAAAKLFNRSHAGNWYVAGVAVIFTFGAQYAM